jgi:hypothetical protein
MDKAQSSETLVSYQITMWCHKPKDHDFNGSKNSRNLICCWSVFRWVKRKIVPRPVQFHKDSKISEHTRRRARPKDNDEIQGAKMNSPWRTDRAQKPYGIYRVFKWLSCLLYVWIRLYKSATYVCYWTLIPCSANILVCVETTCALPNCKHSLFTATLSITFFTSMHRLNVPWFQLQFKSTN